MPSDAGFVRRGGDEPAVDCTAHRLHVALGKTLPRGLWVSRASGGGW